MFRPTVGRSDAWDPEGRGRLFGGVVGGDFGRFVGGVVGGGGRRGLQPVLTTTVLAALSCRPCLYGLSK